MNDDTDFFDRHGRATCHSPDGENLYLWNGKPVGYVDDDRIYSYRGRLLGWFLNGWVYDRSNRPALFSAAASGGPVRPVRQARPAKSARQARPARSVRQVAHVRPVRSMSWSPVAGADYFDQ